MATITVKLEDKALRRMLRDLRVNAPKRLASAVSEAARRDRTFVKNRLHKITGVPKGKILKSRQSFMAPASRAQPPQYLSTVTSVGRYIVAEEGGYEGSRAYRIRRLASGALKGKLYRASRTFRDGVIPHSSRRGVGFVPDERQTTGLRPIYGPNLAVERLRPEFQKVELRYATRQLRKYGRIQLNKLVKARYR